MKNYIDSFKLFEANGNVNGLDQFMNELKTKFPDKLELLDDLKAFIMQSGCPAIGFDTLYGASGISKTDKCIIDTGALNKGIQNALYVILHEITHQYQYSKYGKDVMWDAYSSNIGIEEAVDLLMNIELVADRLAILKSTKLLKDHQVETKTAIKPYYSSMSRFYFKNHLENLRKVISSKGIESVEDVNELMYNKLKEKPKFIQPSRPKQNTYYSPHRKSEKEKKIDAILDKLSAEGWSSLSKGEKETLRAASR